MAGGDYEARFAGVRRLLGAMVQEKLRRAHVCIVGVGGVGSWAVEALARTGVGELTLVDFDEICISNVNRQLPALTGCFGRPKVMLLAERVRFIQPEIQVHAWQKQFTAGTAAEILDRSYSVVLDAMDRPAMKALLIAACRDRSLPVVSSGAAGGRTDPTTVRVADLARVTHDRLLQATRKLLRTRYGFPRQPGRLMNVLCVYSPQPPVYPGPDGTVCSQPPTNARLHLDCRSGYGTACYVTGAFGFAAASLVVQCIAGPDFPGLIRPNNR
ncbi:MAG: tRNA threonylcarbamoyladenosine dehydratase [Verrucomicrobiota bacterium]|nr:tRNA threonylcarbamoyladenosine dehydratase [Limisphaera sp.]MDW8381552.1 tRNA threonylcarbamoyladenosine dehydratase [Verrucomicrobiota bacterium]